MPAAEKKSENSRTNLKSRSRARLVRRLNCVSRISMYGLFPVYGRSRWGRVARVGLSKSPTIRAVRSHVFWLVRRSHVSHVRGMMSRWVLTWVVHGRSVPWVIRWRRRSSWGRTVES